MKTRALHLRYLLAGATCALTNNIIMIGADLLGLHYSLGAILSFLIVTPLAFWLQSRFTFGAPLSFRNLIVFTLGVASGFPLSLIAMAVMCSALHLPVMFAAPVTTVLLIAWNYRTSRFAIMGGPSRQQLG